MLVELPIPITAGSIVAAATGLKIVAIFKGKYQLTLEITNQALLIFINVLLEVMFNAQ